ncbi:hypothetical protein [Paracoccus mutanolyticus]|uniref:hypothetical protein n=1 Tax=Paracoccus mutanolyticus TaxID=1499308 RepID=UPI001CB8F6B2|nr:hypothetical protein [Paracoccus mutanolyticus]
MGRAWSTGHRGAAAAPFAISWLRQTTIAQFRYLIEVRDLTDEEAFRLADIRSWARTRTASTDATRRLNREPQPG